MAPAVYVDMGFVGPHKAASCVWTSTMALTTNHIVALEITLRPITPYILPLLIVIYPLYTVTKVVQSMDESKTKTTLFSCVLLAWSYFSMNLPYALLLIVESVANITGVSKMNNKYGEFKMTYQAWPYGRSLVCIGAYADGWWYGHHFQE